MRIFRPIAFLMFTLMYFPFLFAQVPASSADDAVEQYMDRGSEQNDIQAETDELEYLRSHPVDVSHPVYGELIRLPMLSPMSAESIILFSDTVNITDVEQLRSAELMNDILFEQIKPFVTADQGLRHDDWSSFLPGSVELRTRTEKRLQESKGYSSGRYIGSERSIYQRMKFSGYHTEAGFLFEKDPGEVSSDGFMTGSLSLKDVGPIQRLTLGDFSFASDQGLVFAKSLSSSKGNNVINQTRKRGRIIVPNTSADELHFFRGAAVEIPVSGIQLDCFYSQRNLPASLDNDGVVTSLYTSGLFRNGSERTKKNVMGEKTFGIRAAVDLKSNDRISLNLLDVHYSRPFSQEVSSYDHKQNLSAGSIAYDVTEGPYSFFGEAAMNDEKNHSFSGGMTVQLSRSLALSYHYRSYGTGYYTPYAHPFGERYTISDGEHGHYLGLAFTKDHYSVNVYYDRTLYPPVSGDLTASGTESFLSIEIPLTKKCELYLHTRRTVKTQFEFDELSRTNYRGEMRLNVSRTVTVTNRVEWTKTAYRTGTENESGLLIFTDVAYRYTKNGIRLRSRLILFDSPSYESRLYQFESDVSGNYSNPPLYGHGIRWYFVFGYELFSDMVCSFKCSITKKLHVTSMGSGDDSIFGNSDGQLALQLDFRM